MKTARFIHRYLVRQTMPSLAVSYYDRLIDSIADAYLGPFCTEVFRILPGPAQIVDAGAGTGQLAMMLAQGNPGYEVLGIDLSEACLRSARKKAARLRLNGHVVFERASVEDCPLPSGSVDLVVSTCSLHHWRRPDRVLRNLARLLKPSGEIWVMDDSAEATRGQRREWVNFVVQSARVGRLFRSVFSLESRFLAYSREDVVRLCGQSGLRLLAFKITGVFFLAKMATSQHE